MIETNKKNGSDAYPRVLVFGPDPFNYVTGLGVTLSNLFMGWPKDRIACAYSECIDPDMSVCSSYFKLTESDYSICFPFNLIKRCYALKRAFFAKKEADIACRDDRSFTSRVPICLKDLAGSIGVENFRVVRIDDDFRRWITEFDPEIIYLALESLPYAISTLVFAGSFRAAIAVHILDDWPVAYRIRAGMVRSLMNVISENYLKRAFITAKTRFCIGEDMCSAYAERYSLPFSPFQNCPDKDIWIKRGKSDWRAGAIFKFVFTGAVYDSWNMPTIWQICRASDLVNRRSVYKVEIDIYSSPDTIARMDRMKPADLGQSVNFKMIFPDQTEMAGLYARSDGLLLPFGFGDRNVVKYRYSVPTKLPAYMLSGSPIFACVPGDSVVAGLMNDNCAGFVVSDAEDIEALSRSIEKFCADEHLRRRIGLNARDFAAQKMSGDVVRPGFIKALSEII